MTVEHEFVRGPGGWWDLSAAWDEMCEKGDQRDRGKRGYKSARYWTRGKLNSHQSGFIGEVVVTLETGRPLNDTVTPNGDGGIDFVVNGNVWNAKAATHFDPELKQGDSEKWADRFILIAVDEENKRARWAGWATKDEVAKAPYRDYGYGPKHHIKHYDLHQGIPEELLANRHIQ